MARISDLSEELLVKILTFLPTKVAVSTSLLSKQWQFLWLWLPKIEYDDYDDVYGDLGTGFQRYRDFIDKYLPLHRAPIIEILHLRFTLELLQPEDLKSWVGIAVSRRVRELSISHFHVWGDSQVLFPCSLYSCTSLVTLKLEGKNILVDVSPTVCLPCLKTLDLRRVTYSNEDSLRLLLSHCPVLQHLLIYREYKDNVGNLVISVPSLQRLTLFTEEGCPEDDEYVIITPSLKYFQVCDDRESISYLIEHMPELEEANITVMEATEKNNKMFLKSITAVKRLTFRVEFNTGGETVYPDGIVFSRLENLKLYICCQNWSMLLVNLLKDSPDLRILDLEVDNFKGYKNVEYEPASWSNNQGSVPTCFLNSLETFKFKEYDSEEQEDRDFLSFIFKHARCLKSTSIVPQRFDVR